MFLASLLRRIAFSYYDYKANNFNIGKTDFVVIHIPDQIGDAMAIFPVIRALELHKINISYNDYAGSRNIKRNKKFSEEHNTAIRYAGSLYRGDA